MKHKIPYKISIYDWLLTAFILFVSMGSLFSFQEQKNDNGLKALIFKENSLIKEVILSENARFHVDEMEIEVIDNRIRVSKSDCPRKICIHTGWISDPSKIIVCAANKVIIEIAGEPTETAYDVLTY